MDAIRAAFGGKTDLYEILGVQRNATTSELKKAYYRLARKCHPDKNGGDSDATSRFQALGLIHSVLSKPESRTLYDESGEIDQSDNDSTSTEWCDYWRTLFPKVTGTKIDAFKDKYKGSEEEQKDVLEAYRTHKGDMEQIMAHVLLAEEESDQKRFQSIIAEAIKNGEVENFEMSCSSAKARRCKKKKESEAAEADALLKAIQGRQKCREAGSEVSTYRKREFDSMINDLENKYSQKSEKKNKGPKKKKKAVVPSEEEFLAIQQRLVAGKQSKGK